MAKKPQSTARTPRQMAGEPKRTPQAPLRGFAVPVAGNIYTGNQDPAPANAPAPTALPTAPKGHFDVPNGGVPGSASAPSVMPSIFEQRNAARRKGGQP